MLSVPLPLAPPNGVASTLLCRARPDNDTHVRALRGAPGQARLVETVEASVAEVQPHPQAWLRAA